MVAVGVDGVACQLVHSLTAHGHGQPGPPSHDHAVHVGNKIQDSSRDVIARLLLRMQDMGTTGGGTGEELPDDHWRGILLQLLSRLQDMHEASRAPAVAVAELLTENLALQHDADGACEATSCTGGRALESAAQNAAKELELVSCMRVSDARSRASRAEAQAHARASEAQAKASEAEVQAHVKAFEAQTRASEAEAQAQARASDAQARASEAEAQARARIAQAEVAAAEEIRRLQARVQAAEAAAEFASARAHMRVSEADAAIRAAEVRSLVHIADLEAETEAMAGGNRRSVADVGTSPLGTDCRHEWSDIWTGSIGDLPQGLSQRMLTAELALEGVSSSVGGAGAVAAASALRRARRAHGELHSVQSKSEETLQGVVRWCTLLAIALDSVLEFWCPPTQVPPLPGTQSPTRPELVQGARALNSDEAKHARTPSALEMQEVQREVEELLEESVGFRRTSEGLGASVSPAVPPPVVSLPVVAQQEKQQPQQQQQRLQLHRSNSSRAASSGSTAVVAADEEEEDGKVLCWDAFRAVPPEAELSLTIAEVQRSAALDQVRLNEELRTLSLQHGMMQQQLEQSVHATQSSRVRQPCSPGRQGKLFIGPTEVQPRGRSQTPSPRRLSRQPSRQPPRSPSAEPSRSRAPASPALDAHLRGSSPAMRAAAQRWGRPQDLASSASRGLSCSTTSLLHGGSGIGCGSAGSAGLHSSSANRCARHSPVRARHSLLQRPAVAGA